MQKRHFLKFNIHSLLKTPNKQGMERNFPNEIKGMYVKPAANAILNGKKLHASL